MTDLTTRSVETGAPGPALVPAPVNGAVVGDIRTLRHASRAEQERLSADAEVERRARAARLDLELREQRRAADRREREADAQAKRERAEQRRTRRAARRARLRAAAPLWAERALFVLPIMFPMAVAWAGQIRFAMTVMHWPLPAAIVFAAGFELSTAYVARLDWRSRAAGDNALLFRAATWAFAAGAAVMNYWHAADPGLAPNGEAVSYGLMSITGVVLWELLSTYRHRTALRAEGKLPAARPRFGLARWIWFAKLTHLAWLIALRDGYPTTDLAWRAALDAVDRYGSARTARTAVRAGRPVPLSQPLDNAERDSDNDAPPANTADPCQAFNHLTHRNSNHRDGEPDDAPVPVDSERPAENPATGNPRGSHANQTDDAAAKGRNATRADAAPEPSRPAIDGAVRGRMEEYARARLADGASITGADLDRQFGTRDYGRKILRRLTAASGSALR